MRRAFLVIAVCFICSAAAFAEALDSISFETDPLGWNSDIKLSLYAASGSRAERNKWPAFVLNMILGFGIGSYVQGDIIGGTIGLVGDIAGFGLIIGGAIIAPVSVHNSYTNTMANAALGMILGGFLLKIGMTVFELVRPFTYANKVSVTFAPGVNENGKPAFTSYVSFKY